MGTKYDNIIGAGCSFIHGSNILVEKDGKFAGNKLRAAKLIADKLGIPEINLAHPGASNDRILYSIYEYWSKNQTSNDLYIIGTSGISRQLYYSNLTEKFWDIHAFDYMDDDTSLKRSERLFGENTLDFYKEWREKEAKYLFNIEVEQKKLCLKILGLSSFLKLNNINHIFLNSIDDHISPIKEKINYLSFNIPKNSNKEFNKSDFFNTLTIEDCWYHYLRIKHDEVCKDYNDTSYRISYPPYGKWFCGGHPSPNAHKDLSKKIIEFHNELYPEYKI